MPPHKPSHIQQKEHADHDHVVKRLEEYIQAYKSAKPEAMMEFYHPEDLTYSDFSQYLIEYTENLHSSSAATNREGMGHQELEKLYHHTFNNFHDLKIKTLSVHGHKNFTAWEWEITCKPAIEVETGKKLSKEEAPARKFIGCALMWWENDKIIRHHDYMQIKEPVPSVE